MVFVLFIAVSPVPRAVSGIQQVPNNDCLSSAPFAYLASCPTLLYTLCFSSTLSFRLLECTWLCNSFTHTIH